MKKRNQSNERRMIAAAFNRASKLEKPLPKPKFERKEPAKK